MEKRLILAVALSLLVLLSWSAFVSKTHHLDNKGVTEKTLTPQSAPEPQISTAKPSANLESKRPPLALWKSSQDKYDILFSESQAAIKEVIFKDYHSSKFNLEEGFFLDASYNFQKEAFSSSEQVTFVYNDKEKSILKRFYFSNSGYNIRLELEVRNLSQAPITFNLPLVLGLLNFAGDQTEARFQDVTIVTKDKTLHLNARKEVTVEGVQFIGLRNRYFCAIIEPETNNYSGFIKKISPQEAEIGISTKEFILSPGQKIQQKFNIYLGPQELKQISIIKPEWTEVMHYGTFNVISHLLLQLLDLLYKLVRNWGWVIIILSFLIYFLLYPLTLKQLRSAKQMQALQPHIEELRKNYKDNPQKLNTEIMKLYREYKINPLSGCLPLILQMPIFFALYQVLMRSVALKGAKFLWIKDLSQPDRLFIFPAKLPIIGDEFNILPIVMAIGMFIQQKKSMGATAASSTSAEQQKLMMIIFPLMFGFIFYHMPSGLVLYWFINSALMLFYQIRAGAVK